MLFINIQYLETKTRHFSIEIMTCGIQSKIYMHRNFYWTQKTFFFFHFFNNSALGLPNLRLWVVWNIWVYVFLFHLERDWIFSEKSIFFNYFHVSPHQRNHPRFGYQLKKLQSLSYIHRILFLDFAIILPPN